MGRGGYDVHEVIGGAGGGAPGVLSPTSVMYEPTIDDTIRSAIEEQKRYDVDNLVSHMNRTSISFDVDRSFRRDIHSHDNHHHYHHQHQHQQQHHPNDYPLDDRDGWDRNVPNENFVHHSMNNCNQDNGGHRWTEPINPNDHWQQSESNFDRYNYVNYHPDNQSYYHNNRRSSNDIDIVLATNNNDHQHQHHHHILNSQEHVESPMSRAKNEERRLKTMFHNANSNTSFQTRLPLVVEQNESVAHFNERPSQYRLPGSEQHVAHNQHNYRHDDFGAYTERSFIDQMQHPRGQQQQHGSTTPSSVTNMQHQRERSYDPPTVYAVSSNHHHDRIDNTNKFPEKDVGKPAKPYWQNHDTLASKLTIGNNSSSKPGSFRSVNSSSHSSKDGKLPAVSGHNRRGSCNDNGGYYGNSNNHNGSSLNGGHRTSTSSSSSSTNQNSSPHSSPMIEIAPGVFGRLRGAAETMKCIETDFYMPSECLCCEQTVFCVLDAGFVICPHCRSISPNHACSFGDDPNVAIEAGVGLGFTIEELAQWQSDIEQSRYRKSSNTTNGYSY